MKVTFNFFAAQMRDPNGGVLSIPNTRVGGQTMTATGAANAAPSGSKFVEVATDTALTIDGYGSGTATLIPAGGKEYFPVDAGQIFTLS